jgi:hypothetical protein
MIHLTRPAFADCWNWFEQVQLECELLVDLFCASSGKYRYSSSTFFPVQKSMLNSGSAFCSLAIFAQGDKCTSQSGRLGTPSFLRRSIAFVASASTPGLRLFGN